MDTDNQINRQQIIKQVAKRIIEKQEEIRIEKKYAGYTEEEIKYAKEYDIGEYKENHGREKFNKTLDFLHMTKQKKYLPIFPDIAYIIALIYDIYKKPEPRHSFQYTLKNFINETYENLDANQLASFFMPFYNIENWETLKNTNEINKFKDFLHEHKETLNLFTELWELNIKCYQLDLKLLCTSFYNHNDLPSKEKYQKMLNAYEK